MAQFILWNWQDDDSTKNMNHRLLGPLEPGRYRGFDTDLNTPGGLTLRLHHNTTGVNVTKFDPAFGVEMRGSLLSKQGVIIQENDVIDLPIAPNSTALPRIDLVVCEHEYVDVQNASIATYIIEQGTPANTPIPPTLTGNVQTKLIIGQLFIPANTTDLSSAGVIYTPSPIPAFANNPLDTSDVMYKSLTQTSVGKKTFEKETQFDGVRGKVGTAVLSAYKLTLSNTDYNYFVLNSATQALATQGINLIDPADTGVRGKELIIFNNTDYPIIIRDGTHMFVDHFDNKRAIWMPRTALRLVNISTTATPLYYPQEGVNLKNFGNQKIVNGALSFHRTPIVRATHIALPSSLYNSSGRRMSNLFYMAGGTGNVQSFPSLDIENVSDLNFSGGTVVFMHVGPETTFVHADLAGVPTENKPFECLYGQDLTVSGGGFVMMYESTNTWIIMHVEQGDPLIIPVQEQTDWEQTDDTELDYLKNKPSMFVALAAGYIDVGDVGGIGVGTFLSGFGFSTAQVVSANNRFARIRVTLSSPMENYLLTQLILEVNSQGNVGDDTTLRTPMTVGDRSSTSFDFWLEEHDGKVQDIGIVFSIIKIC